MRRSTIAAQVLARFALPRRVLARYLAADEHLSKEFTSPEALREYLHEHPNADKSKHTVKKPGDEGGAKDEPKPEGKGEKKDEESKGESKGEGGAKAAPKKSMFSDEEMNMPKLVSQKTSDPEKLFESAKDAHEHQLNWLNHGKGLDKDIGAKVVRGDKGENVDPLTIDGPVILIGPMKKMERVKQKAEADYGGDFGRIGDIVRGTVAVDSLDQLDDVMEKLRASGLKLARKPTDRFAKPTEAGYRDILMNVEFPNGHVGELQLHLKPILKAKAEGHHYYEQYRDIEAAAKKEGRTEFTDEEQKKVDELNAKQRELYDNAFQSAGKKAPAKKEAASIRERVLRRVAKETKYYDFNGMPAVWEYKKFPQKVTFKGEKTVYELGQFFTEATPITEAEYKKLREDFDKQLKK